MKMSAIAIDPNRRELGAWVKDIPDLPGVELKVRGSDCAEARKLRTVLIEQIPRARRLRGRIAQEDRDEIETAVLHRVLLQDWRGIEDDDDKPEAYSKDKALAYLTDPRFTTFRNGVIWATNVVAEDQEAGTEADAGNSSKPSAGKSSGATEKRS
jgi:hypothetical protein